MQEAGVGTLRCHFDWRNVQSVSPAAASPRPRPGSATGASSTTASATWPRSGSATFPYLPQRALVRRSRTRTPRRSRSKKDMAASWVAYLDAAVRRYGQGGEYWKRYFPRAVPRLEAAAGDPLGDLERAERRQLLAAEAERRRVREAARDLAAARSTRRSRRPTSSSPASSARRPRTTTGSRRSTTTAGPSPGQGIGKYFDDVGVHPYGPTLKRVKMQMGWVLEEMKSGGLPQSRHLGHRDRMVLQRAPDDPRGRPRGPGGSAEEILRPLPQMRQVEHRAACTGTPGRTCQPGVALCEFCDKAGLVTDTRETKPSYSAFRQVAGD